MKAPHTSFVLPPRFTSGATLLLAMVIAAPGNSAPSVPQQEQFWAERISSRIDKEQITWLEKDAVKFLALYRQENSGHQEGAAIILHEAGTHPAWPEVVDPLRRLLPEHGWSTLSLQMPVPGKALEATEQSALDTEVAGRITAAIGFLNDKGVSNIALIGYGLGAQMALAYVEQHPDAAIGALIGISPHSSNLPEKAGGQPSFRIAMLDIYAERDLPLVLKTVARHLLAARRAGLVQTVSALATERDNYRLLLISGADHSFRGYEEPLVKRLLGWLRHHAPGISMTRSAY